MAEASTLVGKCFLEDCVSIDTWCSTGLGLSLLVSFSIQRVVTLAGVSLAELGALRRVSSAKNPDLTSLSCVFCMDTTRVLQKKQEHLETQDVCPSPNF